MGRKARQCRCTYALDESRIGMRCLGDLVEQDQQLRALLGALDCFDLLID